MGFVRIVREELTRVENDSQCCRQATMAGLVHTAGTFLIRGGTREEDRYEIRVASTVQLAVKMVYSYFKALGAEGQLITSREPDSDTDWSTRCVCLGRPLRCRH